MSNFKYKVSPEFKTRIVSEKLIQSCLDPNARIEFHNEEETVGVIHTELHFPLDHLKVVYQFEKSGDVISLTDFVKTEPF